MANDKPLVVQGFISGAGTSINCNPTTRLGHFLLPRAQRAHLPALPSPPRNASPIRHGDLQVEFRGWPVAPELWKVWVDKLRPRHEHLWRELGIFHAILATTCWVERDEGALLQLVSFWSGDTNTFVFPWGEATVTLEDVAVLAGLPLVGESVRKAVYGEHRGDVPALDAVRCALHLSSWNLRASHSAWAKYFSDLPPEEEGGVLEHGGFLAMWLCLFVLPAPPLDAVRKEVLDVAARLARGGSVALAPAVLASIYGDLSALKRCISSGERSQPFVAWAPLRILQLWVWERFPELRPPVAAPSIRPPRDVPSALRRWHGAHRVLEPRYVHAVLMSPAKFEWAPYGSRSLAPAPGSYSRRDVARRRELLSFAHCLRACELVGMSCIEQYCPHRVARQLGFDQDVPGAVARANSDWSAAWKKYKVGLVVKFSFIVPSNEPTVTAEYEQWWEPCSRACATAVAEAARMKVSALTQITENVDHMLPGWVRNGAKRTGLRKKLSQGSSGAAAVLTSAVDEPTASVAEKERSKSLQQQRQEDAPRPVTMPDEQNSISEQAQAFAHHFVSMLSSLLKPSEERQPVATGNSEPGNAGLKVDVVQEHCVSELAGALKDLTLQQEPAEVLKVDGVQEHSVSVLAGALKDLTLQQEPADGVAAIRNDAGPTQEARTCAVTGEMGKRALKGKSASLGGNGKGGSKSDTSSPNQQMEPPKKCSAEANQKRSGNGGTSSSRPFGENPAPESPEVCTRTLYYLSRSDRTPEAWAQDANPSAGDVFQPRRAVGTKEMIEKASAIRRAESAELRKTIMKQVEEIRALEAAEKQERVRLNRKK